MQICDWVDSIFKTFGYLKDGLVLWMLDIHVWIVQIQNEHLRTLQKLRTPRPLSHVSPSTPLRRAVDPRQLRVDTCERGLNTYKYEQYSICVYVYLILQMNPWEAWNTWMNLHENILNAQYSCTYFKYIIYVYEHAHATISALQITNIRAEILKLRLSELVILRKQICLLRDIRL